MVSQHKRFKQRILIERQVLQLVNTLVDPNNQLCGLTDATISVWEKNLAQTEYTNIVKLIRKIAVISHSSNDISREVFAMEELKVVSDSDISTQLNELKSQLIEVAKNKLSNSAWVPTTS